MIRMRHLAFAGALAVLVSAPIAEAQAPAARLEGRLDPATSAAVTRIIDSALVAGLPAGPLVQKALEGASKRAAGERIVLAVRSLAADLAGARRALGADASEAELVAGVGALRAGAAADVLRRVKAARGAESALLPLAVLSDLVSQGIPVDRAVAAVTALAERHASDAQYRALPANARADPKRGAGPGASVGAGAGTDATSPPPARGRPSNPPAKGRPTGRP